MIFLDPYLATLEPLDRSNPYYGETVLAARSLIEDERREIHLIRMIANLRIAITEGDGSPNYENAYCFHDALFAWLCFHTWDGESDPIMFAKHVNSGRYGAGCKTCRPEDLEEPLFKPEVAVLNGRQIWKRGDDPNMTVTVRLSDLAEDD